MESKFRIEGDPKLRLTEEEIDAQKEAQDRIRRRLYRESKLEDLDEDEAKRAAEAKAEAYRMRVRATEDVRAGLDPNLKLPDEDELAEIEAADPDTAHLFKLGAVKPGTPEFHAMHTPPPEEVIEVIGPQGAEGFGIVRRYVGTGPDAGIKELP